MSTTVAVACGGGQRLVLFGGYNADGILRDVWQFDLESREWAAIRIAAGPEPPERAYFRGMYGGVRRVRSLHGFAATKWIALSSPRVNAVRVI